MSRRAPDAGTGGGAKVAAALLLVLVLAVVVLLLVRARPSPDPFDPRSGASDGTRGLVVTLERVGIDVSVSRTVPTFGGVADDGTGDDTTGPEETGSDGTDADATGVVGAPDRVLVLDDRLDDDQRSALIDFTEAGGDVVVADPDSTLHGGSGLDGGAVRTTAPDLPDRRLAVEREISLPTGRCTIGALSSLRGLYVTDGLLFPVGPTEPQCFATDDRSFVVVRRLGDGSITGLGDNELFTNARLRRADNAALAAALLDPAGTPSSGGARVLILLGNEASPTIDDIGSGDDTLVDLVPGWVWASLAMAVLAFGVFAVSRAARPGRVVTEPVSTPFAASELVAATGNLMARAGHAERAGRLVLSRLRRDLAQLHGVEVDAPDDELDRRVAEASGTEPGQVASLLRSSASDDASLVAIVARCADVRRTVERAESAGPSGSPPSRRSDHRPPPGPRAHDGRPHHPPPHDPRPHDGRTGDGRPHHPEPHDGRPDTDRPHEAEGAHA